MKNSTKSFKYCIAFLLIFIASVSIGLAQMPTPTPVQVPTVSGETRNPNWVTNDDSYYYTKTDRSAQVFIPTSNDTTPGSYIVLLSQTHNIGTFTTTTCGFGLCGSDSAIAYRNVLPDGSPGAAYGSDTAYYYVHQSANNGWQYSNIARITITANPQDDLPDRWSTNQRNKR